MLCIVDIETYVLFLNEMNVDSSVCMNRLRISFSTVYVHWVPSQDGPVESQPGLIRIKLAAIYSTTRPLPVCLAREDFKFEEELTVLVENYICDPLGAIENPQAC